MKAVPKHDKTKQKGTASESKKEIGNAIEDDGNDDGRMKERQKESRSQCNTKLSTSR